MARLGWRVLTEKTPQQGKTEGPYAPGNEDPFERVSSRSQKALKKRPCWAANWEIIENKLRLTRRANSAGTHIRPLLVGRSDPKKKSLKGRFSRVRCTSNDERIALVLGENSRGVASPIRRPENQVFLTYGLRRMAEWIQNGNAHASESRRTYRWQSKGGSSLTALGLCVRELLCSRVRFVRRGGGLPS